MSLVTPTIPLNVVTVDNLFGGRSAEKVLLAVMGEALGGRRATFKAFHETRLAVHADPSPLLDEFAQSPLGSGCRLDEKTVVLHDEGLFALIEASGRPGFSTCLVKVWADTPCTLGAAKQAIEVMIGERRVANPLAFRLDWRFTTSQGRLQKSLIEEAATDVLLDEAYPSIPGGIAAFIERYLAAPESVLVLQGPPGTGKTRLIRSLLGAMSRRAGAPASIMYTTDEKALELDELFIEFLTDPHDALVVEDADLLLKARTSGNGVMHKFLNIADGIVRAQHRKTIFSTNLTSLRDIDEALVRPGRCFAHLEIRELTPSEALRLLERLCDQDITRLRRAVDALGVARSHSLARIYAAWRNADCEPREREAA